MSVSGEDQNIVQERDRALYACDALREQRDQANDLTDKIAAELRLVTGERDRLARRCAVRFEETQALKAELVSARTELEQLRISDRVLGGPLIGVDQAWLCLQSDGCGLTFTVSEQATEASPHPCGPLTAVLITVTQRTEGPTE